MKAKRKHPWRKWFYMAQGILGPGWYRVRKARKQGRFDVQYTAALTTLFSTGSKWAAKGRSR